MAEVFGQLISSMHQSAQSMQQASHKLVAANIENQQQKLKALKEANHAMLRLNDSAAAVLRNVESTCALTSAVDEISADNNAVVQATVTAITEVAEVVSSSAANVTELRSNTEQIDSVMSAIRTIAEQTNLLALNAAMKAARVGQLGRGFVIVDDEVRQLAIQTTESTEEIQQIVEQIQTRTMACYELMQQGETATKIAVAQA